MKAVFDEKIKLLDIFLPFLFAHPETLITFAV